MVRRKVHYRRKNIFGRANELFAGAKRHCCARLMCVVTFEQRNEEMSPLKSIFLAISGLACAALAGTANAGTCQAPVSGVGSAKGNNTLARTRAVDGWRTVARNTYGNGYGIWLKAANKGMSCQITGSFPKTHSCTAVATPCS